MDIDTWLKSDIDSLKKWAHTQKCPYCKTPQLTILDAKSLIYSALEQKYKTQNYNGWIANACRELDIPYDHIKRIEYPRLQKTRSYAMHKNIEKICDDLNCDIESVSICDPHYTILECLTCKLRIPAYEYILVKNGNELERYSNIRRLERSTKWLNKYGVKNE